MAAGTNLEFSETGGLTEFDYKFLKGDEKFFPGWGAAIAVVSEYCKNMGYGHFGRPSDLGKRQMDMYEKALLPHVG